LKNFTREEKTYPVFTIGLWKLRSLGLSGQSVETQKMQTLLVFHRRHNALSKIHSKKYATQEKESRKT
jgi:hypothetical protein